MRIEAIEIRIVKTSDGSTSIPTPFSTPISIVNFKDSNLEQAVRENINKPTGTLYQSNVVNITNLDAGGYNISDISSLKGLTNLQYLYLADNQISTLDQQSLEEALPNCGDLYF